MSVTHLVNSGGSGSGNPSQTVELSADEQASTLASRSKASETGDILNTQLKLLNARFEEAFRTRIYEEDVG